MEKQITDKTSEIDNKKQKQQADLQRRRDAAWRNKDKAFLKKEPRQF